MVTTIIPIISICGGLGVHEEALIAPKSPRTEKLH